MTEVLEILNYVFTAIFGLEMLLKLLGLGPYGYIKDPFNLFDGFIVIMRSVEPFYERGRLPSQILEKRPFKAKLSKIIITYLT